MYPLDPTTLGGLRGKRWAGVGPNVFFLGLTSMLTDVSSEMVTAVLPLYLVFAIGLTPLQFGVVDGLSQGIAALARLAGGLMADRWQRNREVAAAGYAASAASRLLLLVAGSSWGLVSSAVALDRIGKGWRTAPRDALISLSSQPAQLGLAFGIHRAMDTAGAMLGPLVAFAILAAMPVGYDVVFVTSFCIAIVGVATLLCFVRNVAPAQAAEGHVQAPSAPRTSLASAAALLKSRPFRALVVAGSVLGLVTVADAFFYLMLQQKMSMRSASFPLLYVATAVAYLLLAIPAGRLGDRYGRGRVLLLGHGLLLLACITVRVSGPGVEAGLLALALLGAYYACTDGVLMAAASRLVPASQRTTGLAIMATATGLARLLASLGFGAVWNAWGIETAFVVFAAGLALALLFTGKTLLRLETLE